VGEPRRGLTPHAWRGPRRWTATLLKHAWIFKTTDYGKTWTSIRANLAGRPSAHTVKEDLKNWNLLFTGSELAIFYSLSLNS
jgi:hypothetical protein